MLKKTLNLLKNFTQNSKISISNSAIEKNLKNFIELLATSKMSFWRKILRLCQSRLDRLKLLALNQAPEKLENILERCFSLVMV